MGKRVDVPFDRDADGLALKRGQRVAVAKVGVDQVPS